MNKRIKLLIPIILLLILMAGCNLVKNIIKPAKGDPITNAKIPAEERTFADQFTTVTNKPISDEFVQILYLNSLMEPEPMETSSDLPIDQDDLLNKFFGVKNNWPAEYLAPDMPEYTSGKISQWYSMGDEYDISITIDGTNQSELDEYILALEANGFYDNYGRYCKGPFSVELEFSYGGSLVITSYKEDVMEWPVDILGFMPPLEKGFLASVNLNPEDGMACGDLYFNDLCEDDIANWEEALKNAGFEVDGYRSYTKDNVELRGKRYKVFSAFFESNGVNEWILYFSFRND